MESARCWTALLAGSIYGQGRTAPAYATDHAEEFAELYNAVYAAVADLRLGGGTMETSESLTEPDSCAGTSEYRSRPEAFRAG